MRHVLFVRCFRTPCLMRAFRHAVLSVLLMAWLVPASAADLLVFAAASLNESLTQVSQDFEQATGNKVKLNFASSATLARQIELGAPADLFISANQQWMDYLAGKNVLDDSSRIDLLHNRLVLIAPANSKRAAITLTPGFPLAKLLGKQHLAVGDPDSVPAGIYAKEALQQLGLWPSVERRLASAADVRSALEYVIRGQAPLGVVYLTDAISTDKVKVIGTFPDSSHAPIVYPAALTVQGSKLPAAQALLKFLQAPAATAVFEHHGFHTSPDH